MVQDTFERQSLHSNWPLPKEHHIPSPLHPPCAPSYPLPTQTHTQGAPLTFRAWAAAPVYVALSYLVSKPNSSQEAFCMGLSVYAVYDFTNLSTLDGWSWRFALADSLWGGVITAIVFSILVSPTVARWLE